MGVLNEWMVMSVVAVGVMVVEAVENIFCIKLGGSLYVPMCKNLKPKNESGNHKNHTILPRDRTTAHNHTITQPQQATIVIITTKYIL